MYVTQYETEARRCLLGHVRDATGHVVRH